MVQSLLSTEIDGAAARTLADYKELALGLLNSWFVLGRPPSAVQAERRSAVACVTMTLDLLPQVELQPHFVRRFEAQPFVQGPTFIAGVQIDRAQALLLD